MAPTATVSIEDIVAALSTSERFPAESPQFDIFASLIGHLAEIVGEDRLDDIVEFGSLCDVTSQYVSWLASNDEFLGKLDPFVAGLMQELYSNMASQMKVISNDPESVLASLNLTSEAFMVSDELGLNETAKELARQGELTFAKLLTTSAGRLHPRNELTPPCFLNI